MNTSTPKLNLNGEAIPNKTSVRLDEHHRQRNLCVLRLEKRFALQISLK